MCTYIDEAERLGMLHPDNEDWQSTKQYESLMNLARKWYIFKDSQMDEFQPSIRLRVYSRMDGDDDDSHRRSGNTNKIPRGDHEIDLGRTLTASQVRRLT
jgi:hypothetical protein